MPRLRQGHLRSQHRMEAAVTVCPAHVRTAPCASCSADHLAGEHPNRDRADTCPRCEAGPPETTTPDAASLAAGDDTYEETS
jgi:hypothetical protein